MKKGIEKNYEKIREKIYDLINNMFWYAKFCKVFDLKVWKRIIDFL